MNFTDEEREELEAQYEDVDDKLIQIQILMELSQIRMLLEGAQMDSEGGESKDVYRCTSCNEVVDAQDRQAHAEDEHNAPSDMDPSHLFDPCD